MKFGILKNDGFIHHRGTLHDNGRLVAHHRFGNDTTIGVFQSPEGAAKALVEWINRNNPEDVDLLRKEKQTITLKDIRGFE